MTSLDSLSQLSSQILNMNNTETQKCDKLLKDIALILGIFSAIAIIFDWYPLTMFLSFPFCLIWIYCAWLHTEPQLKWINLIFLLIYLFGISRYFLEL